MQINIDELKKKVSSVLCATTKSEMVEQTTDIIFTENKMIAFNTELKAETEFDFDNQTFSVNASDFQKMLNKFGSGEFDFSIKNDQLEIKDKTKRAKFRITTEILCPFNEVEAPEKWAKINPDFWKSVIDTSWACGNDISMPKTTHVHITKDYVEASDATKIIRATLSTKMKETMIPKQAIDLIGNRLLTHFCFGENWLHLKSDEGVVYSILTNPEPYFPKETIDGILDGEGEKVVFPPELNDMISRSEIMCEDDFLTITLDTNKLTLKAEKETGSYTERKKVKYAGRAFSFYIKASIFKFLSDKGSCSISDRIIKLEKENMVMAATVSIKD